MGGAPTPLLGVPPVAPPPPPHPSRTAGPPPARPAAQVPTDAQAASVTEELRARSRVPAHVKSVLESLPAEMHPMTQFCTLVLALQVCTLRSIGVPFAGRGRARGATRAGVGGGQRRLLAPPF